MPGIDFKLWTSRWCGHPPPIPRSLNDARAIGRASDGAGALQGVRPWGVSATTSLCSRPFGVGSGRVAAGGGDGGTLPIDSCARAASESRRDEVLTPRIEGGCARCSDPRCGTSGICRGEADGLRRRRGCRPQCGLRRGGEGPSAGGSDGFGINVTHRDGIRAWNATGDGGPARRLWLYGRGLTLHAPEAGAQAEVMETAG